MFELACCGRCDGGAPAAGGAKPRGGGVRSGAAWLRIQVRARVRVRARARAGASVRELGVE